MVNRLAIYSFIVLLLGIYGLWFWVYLELLGLCRTLFWGCYGVGKAALVIIEMVIFGPSFLFAYCGVFGGRNSRCFENIESSFPDLKLLFFRTLRDWLFALRNQSFPSFIDFLDSYNFCIWFLIPCNLYTPCVLECSFLYQYNLWIENVACGPGHGIR